MSKLIPVQDAIRVLWVENHPERSGEIYCAVVDCADFEAFKALPDAARLNGVLLTKTGWDSDNRVAFFKPDGLLLTRV